MAGALRTDPLFKGTLRLKQHGVVVTLEVLEGVFAGAGVDAGTRQLLRRLAELGVGDDDRILDVGCGYGPLALWLAAAAPGRTVLAVDRDARALACTAAGTESNGLAGRVEVRGSLGYDDVLGDDRFDLVVSNIPAKVGAAALDHLLLDAARHLSVGGLVGVVVIDRLAQQVADRLVAADAELVATYPSKGYSVFVYRPPPSAGEEPRPTSGFEQGVYLRGRGEFRSGRLAWAADVSYSIPEFDTLGHGTLAAVELLPARHEGLAAVVDVGQGHLALALRASGHDGPIRLVDRDLLALRTTAANLGGADVDLRHRSRPLGEDLAGAALVVVALPEREPVAMTAAVLGAALGGVDAGATVVLHGRTADVSRVLELLPRHGPRLVEGRRVRHGGHAAALASVAAGHVGHTPRVR